MVVLGLWCVVKRLDTFKRWNAQSLFQIASEEKTIHGFRMIYDLTADSGCDNYDLLTQAVVPRPIAWILSENADGGLNLAPFSYFNLVAQPAGPVLRLDRGARRPISKGYPPQPR